MATIGRLAVKIDADTAGLSTGLSQADGKVKAFEGRIGAMSDSMALATVAAGALGAALAGGGLLSKLVTVQREFDVLNASMITMTGSASAAQKEFAWLKDFAATTPFALNEVVGAFVRMQSLGLQPTQAALESFGNTASAMGKSLNQMIEAVADASTGEFERLKEFGIKARKEGDNVSLTFQGVTTTIRNSAAEITGYLEGLGKNEFAGAMAERAKTLDGAISNLADSWDELFRTVNESGVGDVMAESARSAATALGKLSEGLKENRVEVQALAGAVAGGALLVSLPALAAGLGKVALGVRAIGLAMAANPLTLALLGIGAAVGGVVAYQSAMDKTTDGMRRLKMELESANNGILNMKGLAGLSASERAAYDDRVAKIKEITSALAVIDAPTGSVGSGDTALRRAEAATAVTGGGKVSGGKATGGGKAKEKSIFDNGDPVQQDLQDRLDKVDSGDAAIRRQEERDKNYAAELADFERRAQALKDYHKTEEELKLEKHEKELEQLALDRENGFLTEQEYMLMEQDLAMKHMDELARIRNEGEKRITDFAKMGWEERTNFIMAQANALTQGLTQNSKAAFNIQKAANIAQAIMDTHAGAARALKDFPAPISYGVAAATVVAGIARVNAIKSQQFGGTSAAGGGGSTAMPSAAAAGGGAAQGMQQTITIQGIGAGDIFGGESVRLLIDKLIDAQRNGAKILLA